MSTLSEVKAYVRYWQPLLRLKDWKITISIITDPKDNFYARITNWRKDQEAKIEILDPKDVPEKWRGVRDLEVTLLHELLHIRLCDCINTSKRVDDYEELVVETLAKLLVATRRGISPEELV